MTGTGAPCYAQRPAEAEVEQPDDLIVKRAWPGHGGYDPESQHGVLADDRVDAVGQVHHVGRPGHVELIVEVAVGQRVVDVDLECGHQRRQERIRVGVAIEVIADADVVVDHRDVANARGDVERQEAMEKESVAPPEITNEWLNRRVVHAAEVVSSSKRIWTRWPVLPRDPPEIRLPVSGLILRMYLVKTVKSFSEMLLPPSFLKFPLIADSLVRLSSGSWTRIEPRQPNQTSFQSRRV